VEDLAMFAERGVGEAGVEIREGRQV